jgi:predicted MFS family arabinose efflux permease
VTVSEQAQAAAVEAGESHPLPGRGLLHARPWAAVGILTAIAAVNTLDRFLPSILAEPMKRDLGLSDAFLGWLNGAAFLFVYAVAGIPIAAVADRGRYGRVISVSLAFWSLMTGLSGLVVTAWQAAATRIGVALGEAGATPASHAYISRNVKPEHRAQAFSVMTAGMPVGNTLALVAGGLMAEQLGWRGAFLVMGVIGVAMAPAVRLALGAGHPAPRPIPAASGAPAASGLLARELRKPSVIAVCAASGLMAFGAYAAGAFAPAFLIRVHGFTVAQAGVQLGLINGAISVAAMLAMGWLGDRLSKLDARWPLALLAAISVVSIPFAIAAYGFVRGPMVPLAVALALLGAGGYFGLAVASLHTVVAGPVRARISAVLLFITAACGGLGPVVTGMISDHLAPALGHAALARALVIVTPASYLASALVFLAATATYRRDMAEAAARAD